MVSDYDNCSTLDEAIEIWKHLDSYYYAYPDEYRTCHEHYEIDGVSRMMGVDDFCSKAERK